MNERIASRSHRRPLPVDPVKVSAAVLRAAAPDILPMVEAAIRIKYGPEVLYEASDLIERDAR